MCLDSKDELIETVFDIFQYYIGNANYFKSRIAIVTTNEIVNKVNDDMVERVEGETYIFASINTMRDVDSITIFYA